MTAPTSMSVFHQWLLAQPASTSSACAIILHCPDSPLSIQLIQGIAEYLNEYDDDGDGHWLPATPDLIAKISHNENHRRLLGIDSAIPDDSLDPLAGYCDTVTGLGLRGHVVFGSPAASQPELPLANTFHAGVGRGREITKTCHLILNSELIDQKCIAHIIGDVFLAWLHCDLRRGTPLHEIR